jgi:hypothetical protein
MKELQAPLPNLRVAIRQPLIGLNGASALLGMTSPELEQLLDLGFLIGFNIAVDGTPGARRELRILVESIQHYDKTSRSFRIEWPALFRNLTPHDKPILEGTEIKAILTCDDETITNLIRAGRLQVVCGTTFGRGRNGTPIVTMESYERFLKQREHCGQFLTTRN